MTQNNQNPQSAQGMSQAHRQQQAALRAMGLQNSQKDEIPRLRLADQIPPENEHKYFERVKQDRLPTNFIDKKVSDS
ncbi:hypothetical protein KKG46_01285 [Patescibacteria group bacterium]|nr:hypothetical protein [Patescibacteria group bacterium]